MIPYKNGFLAPFLAGDVRDLFAEKGSPTPLNPFKGGRGRTYCVSPPLRPPLKIPPETPPRRIIPLHDVRKMSRKPRI